MIVLNAFWLINSGFFTEATGAIRDFAVGTKQLFFLANFFSVENFYSLTNSIFLVKLASSDLTIISLISVALAGFLYLIYTNQKLKKQLSDKENFFADASEKIIELQKKSEVAHKTKRRFLANISHEIRTPLNGILGLINELKRDSLTDSQFELVSEVEMLSNNLTSLLGDIIDYTNLESGKLILDEINFHLFNELDSELNYYRKACNDKGLDFSSTFDKNLPHFFVGDPNRLRQIIFNLLNNALKFTDKGNILLLVDLITEAEETATIKFSVKDTGKGLSASDRSIIGKVFIQTDNENTRENGGTGLGLTMSTHLAKIMGGKLDFESIEGEGSKFWFTVVLKKGFEPKDLNGNHYNKILLVEDNLINQKVSLFSLSNQGFEVDLAENGAVAVEKFRQNTYDLILMDIQMPVMDGITASTLIRKMEAERNTKKPVRIVAITANAIREDHEQCLAAGINGYISKPFNLDKFSLVINQLNGNH
jgi:signal transduction histidine kinase/CheY-like chemotaxis protein